MPVFDGPNPYISLLSPGFVSRIYDLKPSLAFIWALELASLNDDDLDDETIACLQSPPEHTFEIDDKNELYSLKQYLAAEHSSQQTYTEFCKNHNEHFPKQPMLSYHQIHRKVSGVEPIVSDTCPNSSLAYTGPFEEVDVSISIKILTICV